MYGHIQRTYSEWLLSDFARRGREEARQSCHYRQVRGGGQASRFGDLRRDYFVMHGPVVGSTWIQDATFLVWEGRDLDRRALDLSRQRVRLMYESMPWE